MQVFKYLGTEMQNGRIIFGGYLRLNDLSEGPGISKNPLHDAIIQPECKGFAPILPHRSVLMNGLTLKDVKNAYDIVG